MSDLSTSAALLFSLASGPLPVQPLDAQGEFSSPPVLTWQRRIPGPRVPAAVHTERGTPVLDGAYIFAGSAADDALLVMDRSDGRLVRRLQALGPVQSAPRVDAAQNRVYFSDSAGGTHCYRISDGSLIWRHEGKSPILATPMVDGDQVFIANLDNVVTALNRSDGSFLWRHEQRVDRPLAGPQLYGAPTPTRAQVEQREVVLAGFSDGTLVSLDAQAGEVIWQRRVGEGAWPDIIGATLELDGGDAKSIAVAGGFAGPLLAIDPSTRSVRWRVDVGTGEAPIAGPDDPSSGYPMLYHGSADGSLRCIDSRSGEVKWTWDSETQGALTRPVVTAAGLLVGSSSGGLYLVDPVTGVLSWQLETGYLLAGVSTEPAVQGRQAVVVTNAGRMLSLMVPVPQGDGPRGDGDFVRVGGWTEGSDVR